MVYLYFAVAFYVVVYSLSLALALLVRVSDAFRSRRRGGAPRPVALRLVSPVATYTTAGTRPNVASFSSTYEPGRVSAGMVIPHQPPAASRRTVLTGCGAAAGVGDSPGQRRQSAASGDA